MKIPKLNTILMAALLTASPSVFSENLIEIYQLASENDPLLRATAASRNATGENQPQALANFLPQVSASASIGEHFQSQGFESTTSSITLTQSLYSAANYAQMRRADRQVAQANAEYSAAEQDLIIRVSEGYFNVLRAGDDLEFQRADKSAISRQLEQASKRYEVGLIAITDVHEAQARHDQAVAAEIDSQNTLDSRLEDLRQITGVHHQSINALIEAGIPLDHPQPALIEDWVAGAVEQNLTLLGAIRATEAAHEDVSIQRSGHLPTVSLVGTTSRSDDPASTPTGVTDDTSITLQLSIPIYTGGATSSRTRQAEYTYVASRENQEQVRRSVEADTRDAYRGIASAISRVNALEQVLISSQSALDATEAGFEVGTRTIVDVLNAQRTLYGSIRDLKSARYDYLVNTLNLKRAAGTLALADIERINALIAP